MGVSTYSPCAGVGIMFSDDSEARWRQIHLEELAKYQSYRVALSDKGYLIFLDDEGNIPDAEIGRAIAQSFARRYPDKWYIYLAKYSSFPSIYKIGISTNPEIRAYQLSLKLIHTIECKDKTAAIWSE